MTDEATKGKYQAVRTCLGGRCVHPHERRSGWLIDIPTTPTAPGQLLLMTEIGWVPYSGWDNERSCAAAGDLARRHLDVGTVPDAMLVPDSVRALHDGNPVPRYTERRFARPQMLLAMALAEREGRLCIADDLRRRLVEVGR